MRIESGGRREKCRAQKIKKKEKGNMFRTNIYLLNFINWDFFILKIIFLIKKFNEITFNQCFQFELVC